MDFNNAVSIAQNFAMGWEGKPKLNSDGDYIAFDDGYGNPTIGWGSTYYKDGSSVKFGDTMSPSDGDDLFLWELNGKATTATKYVLNYDSMADTQFAAIIDLFYQGGEGNIRNTDLIKDINSGVSGDALKSVWVSTVITSKGIRSQGVVNRRLDEYMLYSGQYNSLYSYYLQNQSTIDTAAIVGGTALVAGLFYWYWRKGVIKL